MIFLKILAFFTLWTKKSKAIFKIYIIPALIMHYKRAEISKQRTFLEIFNPLYMYECAATFIIIKIYVY